MIFISLIEKQMTHLYNYKIWRSNIVMDGTLVVLQLIHNVQEEFSKTESLSIMTLRNFLIPPML